jgi:glycosyltransferase involved in cell wall biosynthesis
LIAISEMTQRDLVEHCGVAESKVSVVRHGVDEQFRILESSEIERYRRAARLPNRFALYLGTIQPRKNLIRLIAAFEKCARIDADLHLVLAGRTGWLSEPILKRVAESSVSSRVRLLGYVPDPQLPALYNAASALVLPSLYEGFGLPVLEAMACGVPVVMSDRGALPELAGADSIAVNPFDENTIAESIRSALERRSVPAMIEKRVEHARQFTWEKAALTTQDILHAQLDAELDAPS